MIRLTLPLTDEDVEKLHAGDMVYLSGDIYSARDAAHARMVEKLPFDIKNQCIYYVGPSQTAPGKVIGSAGPTTSTRMDKYTPFLFDNGLRCCIGKGRRSIQVKEAIVRNKGLYFVTVGGLGALLSKCVEKVEHIAYSDLGPEEINKLTVKDFPVFVGIDCFGNDVYD